jgi:hypothetical protein
MWHLCDIQRRIRKTENQRCVNVKKNRLISDNDRFEKNINAILIFFNLGQDFKINSVFWLKRLILMNFYK